MRAGREDSDHPRRNPEVLPGGDGRAGGGVCTQAPLRGSERSQIPKHPRTSWGATCEATSGPFRLCCLVNYCFPCASLGWVTKASFLSKTSNDKGSCWMSSLNYLLHTKEERGPIYFLNDLCAKDQERALSTCPLQSSPLSSPRDPSLDARVPRGVICLWIQHRGSAVRHQHPKLSLLSL